MHQGGCHCGKVAFEVDAEIDAVTACNCSICTKKGFLHWIVPRQHFRLLRGEDALATYTFNTGVAKHYFCRSCGIASFYVPRSHPDQIDVNLRCLDGVDLELYSTTPFDGRDWEAAIDAFHSVGRK